MTAFTGSATHLTAVANDSGQCRRILEKKTEKLFRMGRSRARLEIEPPDLPSANTGVALPAGISGRMGGFFSRPENKLLSSGLHS
jgi:hypothetical protein